MGTIFTEYGGRILVEETPEEPDGERFAQRALANLQVQETLSGHRWRFLHTEDVWDKASGTTIPEAVYYDYTRNQAVRARRRFADAAALDVSTAYEQPFPSLEEFEAAVDLVSRSPVWGPLLRSGAVDAYPPMPPVEQPTGEKPVERVLYVGLASKPRRFNRIVAVNMTRTTVSNQPVTPRRSLAIQRTCGVPGVGCSSRPRRGAAGALTMSWPSSAPVWRFTAIRPTASSGTNASGIELRDVTYKGQRVFAQAHVPILNVQYDRNLCGPYRDWLWEEYCFQAFGQNINGSPGFRFCNQVPRTIFESGQDGGGFTGVAVYETPQGNLGLVAVMRAGWYRYVMEWQFAPDGRIFPSFRFAGVSNSCVCNVHHHHVLWRFDFDIVRDANVVEEFNGSTWIPITTERSVFRQGTGPRWRVRDPVTNAGYEIIHGVNDSVGDSFSGPDLYALKYRSNEIDDHRGDSRPPTGLTEYVNNEGINNQDIVVWYGAHFRHAVLEDDHGEVEVGPTLQPFNWSGTSSGGGGGGGNNGGGRRFGGR